MSYNRRKKKPLFRKKRSAASTTACVIGIIVLVLALVFLGYSIGKPIVEFFSTNHQGSQEPPVTSDVPDDSQSDTQSPQVTTAPADDDKQETTTVPPTTEVAKNGILYVSFDGSDDFALTLSQAVSAAVNGDYMGICLDLVANGGAVNYTSANKLANSAGALPEGALSLTDSVKTITDAGLLPYARVSALSDHVASWFDRSICYLFEDSSSKWLDNSLSNGGKPWISPFQNNAKEYISDLVSEISDAGFVGIIAGELEFPPFRAKDLGYVGATVQSAERYKALCEFSNVLSDTVGSAKSYSVQVSAYDLLRGSCELLTDASLLNVKTVYVLYDTDEIGSRIVKEDENVISFEGLSEEYKLAQVMKLVNEALSDSGVTVLPAVKSSLAKSEVLQILSDSGFSAETAIIY